MIDLRTKTGASATISKFGAQVLSWKPLPRKQEQLFLSSQAVFDGATAIRGGVPVLFPYFGRRDGVPSHGFARLSEWTLVSLDNGVSRSTARLSLATSDFTMGIWPHSFGLTITITLEDTKLSIELEVLNTGRDDFSFSGGLHTYLRLMDVTESRILGLSDCDYLEHGHRYRQSARELLIDQAMDRIYFCGGTRALSLLSGERVVNVTAVGFKESVVWNPWQEGASTIGDLGDTDYASMVCIESVMAHQQVTLKSKQSWAGSQTLSVAA